MMAQFRGTDWRKQRVDLMIGLGLFLLAIGLRLAWLYQIPLLTDESGEVSLALDILHKGKWIAVANSSYVGSVWMYVLAIVFQIFGVSMYVPRAVVMVIGALTVPITYGLAREFAKGDRLPAFLAALLVAFNSYHILYNSHVAWSAEVAPFFATAALWAYLYGRRARSVWGWTAAGVLTGLAVQTFPFALALLPTIGLDLLLARAWRERKLFAPLASLVGAFLVIASPLICYNVFHGFDSLQTARTRTYAFEAHPTVQTTAQHFGPMLGQLAQLFTGTIRADANALFGLNLITLFAIPLIFAGPIYLFKRGERVPLLFFLCLTLPNLLLNRFFGSPEGSRYVAILLPVGYAAAMAALAQVGQQWFAKLAGEKGRLLWFVMFVPVVFLCLVSYKSLLDLYAFEKAAGRTNDFMLQSVARVKAGSGRIVWLDVRLEDYRTGAGSDVRQSLQYLLRLESIASRNLDTSNLAADAKLRKRLGASEFVYVVIPVQFASSLKLYGKVELLYRDTLLCRGCRDAVEIGLYRVYLT